MKDIYQIEQTLDSREVAQMIEKEHNKLLRDIRRYVEQLAQGNISQSDFFTESTYKNNQNKTQPCYRITKKGCEFIAHKLTGQKGTEFTARYINRFHEMENALQERSTDLPAQPDGNAELMTRTLLEMKNIMKSQEKAIKQLQRRNMLIASRSIGNSYRQAIMNMVEEIRNEEKLRIIYTIVKRAYTEEHAQR